MRRRRPARPASPHEEHDDPDEEGSTHPPRRGPSSARATSPNPRTATDAEALKRAFADHLQYSQGKDEHSATALDRYFAVAHAVRDRLMRRWIQTQQAYYRNDAKRVYYLSLEFLMGKALENNLLEPRPLRADARRR